MRDTFTLIRSRLDERLHPHRYGEGVAVVTCGDGRSLELDLADRTQRRMAFGGFEPGETRAVREILAGSRCFVDVGAHVGWFTTLAASVMAAGAEVWALEAHPVTRERLARNVELNPTPGVDVRILESAASDRAGRLEIGLQRGSDSGSATFGVRGAQHVHEVEVQPLDDLLPADGRVDLLKIDVEGWEPQVLSGAAETLTRTDRVLVEINPSALRANGASPEDVLGLLRSRGFSRFRDVGRPALWFIRRGNARVFRNVLAERGAP